MSFFDDTKNAGLLLLIIALMDIVFALISIFALEDYKDLEMWKKILVIVGAVIGAAILALLGFGIMKGGVAFQIGPFFSDVKSKFGVLVAGTAGIGIADLVEGIFNIIALFMLYKYVAALYKDYRKQKAAGVEDPVFDVNNWDSEGLDTSGITVWTGHARGDE